ncbi:MAG: hypothetical protein SFU98_11825 [Leptospiraceae bacterium]|nr:hypothetical protein [Leptospiraceae bacterium]
MEKYQITKTVRFGLTATNSNLYSDELKDLIETSEIKIKESLKNKSHNSLQIEQLRSCLNGVKEYLKTWNNVYSQIDFLGISKDYYKVISRKARFDFDNKGLGSEVKLASLQSKYNSKKRIQYILDFWEDNFQKTEILYRKSDELLKVFEEAEKQKRDDKKLNEVELRKTFLSLFNLVNESLKPLVEGNLFTINDDKIDSRNQNHEVIADFISNTKVRTELYESITELQNFFRDNGGYVPFGRATFNQWTALQKADKNGEREIDKIIKQLNLETVSMANIDYKYNTFTKNFEQGGQVWKIKQNAKSVIELCQFFKYKKVSITTRLNLAKRLNKTNNFLSEFGISKSPALDYKKDKENFNLANYPLKVAFDYAWENCAKAKHESITFPELQCKDYLHNVFGVDANKDKNGKIKNEELNKYADLLQFKILLGRLKAEFHKAAEETNKNNIRKLKNIFENLDYSGVQDFNKNKIKEIVEVWFANKEKNIGKKKEEMIPLTEKKKDDFSKAMQIIGQERGGLKSRIKKYKTLTEMFKVCASRFGKLFADLRDYFNEAHEVDKIKYRSWILEDGKQNRFVLLVDKAKDLELENEENGELKLYEVKSLTSKSLIKFIKNKGAYPDFHSLNSFNSDEIKKNWTNHKANINFLKNLKSALENSLMAINQNWKEFNFDFSRCDTYEQIEKEIDRKGYILKQQNISLNTIKKSINEEKSEKINNSKKLPSLLFPIVNQDINREAKQEKNQFTKDWFEIFAEENNLHKKRLHPEFHLFYRFPTKNYPNTKFKNGKEKSKRYSRFQMLAHFGLEVFPQGDYISKKEQIEIFNDDKKQKEAVEKYNNSIVSEVEYIIGIDRGIKQLATLCVLNKNGVIQSGFQIYTPSFNHDTKQWEHSFLGKRNILDLSNLRVETTIKNEKVLVDLASIQTKKGENQQKIKLKQLAYIRELQYSMQTRQVELLEYAKTLNSAEDITEEKIKIFISPFKEGSHYEHLPKQEIYNLLNEWQNADETRKRKIQELDPTDSLKSGIVANIVGVIAFFCEKYNYKVRISLEDLTRAFSIQKDALTGTPIHRNDEDFKEQENRRLAGVGTMQFLEMQLLKKLFKLQSEKNKHLIPAFRSVANYEKIVRRDKENGGDEFVNYPFGIVTFVDPRNTSQKCPYCNNIARKEDDAFYRNAGENKNSLLCKKCGLSTIKGKENKSNQDDSKNQFNIHFITDGDQNGAYHIALKTLENLHRLNTPKVTKHTKTKWKK